MSNALSVHEALAFELGMDETVVADFNKQATDFGDIMKKTGYQLTGRKNGRKKLDSLLKSVTSYLFTNLIAMLKYSKHGFRLLPRVYNAS